MNLLITWVLSFSPGNQDILWGEKLKTQVNKTISNLGMMMKEHFLDCKGMKCPMPIVEIFKAFSKLEVGDTLEVVCDDLAFPHDIKAWSEKMGQTVLDVKIEQSVTVAKLKKTKD